MIEQNRGALLEEIEHLRRQRDHLERRLTKQRGWLARLATSNKQWREHIALQRKQLEALTLRIVHLQTQLSTRLN